MASSVKIFFIGTVVLFGTILAVAALKKRGASSEPITEVVEAALPASIEVIEVPVIRETPPPAPVVVVPPPQLIAALPAQDDISQVDLIEKLFCLDSRYQLPIVETVSFTSRVPWLKGRPAWVADYASFYETSRHFIARCLNKKADYFSQKVTHGARFNVFRKDINLSFHLLVDLSKCRMLFYYVVDGAKTLLKTYPLAVGRVDPAHPSDSLTPLGKYALGSRVAIYKLGTMGVFRDQKTEMIRIFGTRWLPFDKEVEGCTKKAKGFGLHGAPWVLDPITGQMVEDRDQVGKRTTDGSLWLAQEDIEELFAIVLTKPTFVEIVKELNDSSRP